MPPEAGSGYIGRFAPSPTGPLHAGSLATALASWLDARAHRGRWWVRIEDIDTPRCVAGADREILRQLATCGLQPDAPPLWQSTRASAYRIALDRLQADDWAFGCACSRADVLAALEAQGRVRERHGELIYPGTCRGGLAGRPARAIRALAAARTEPPYGELILDWRDRRLGSQRQNVSTEVGDFVLRRADGLWAYQLAVVVDDAEQGVTHVVRGEDLADNTPRQIHLQRCLGAPTPAYLHTPLVLGADGEKLSKQNGAAAVDLRDPAAVVRAALGVLGVPAHGSTLAELLDAAVRAWPARLASWAPPS
jgi:glutamyl-Q tRNA(Asp) synthetase